MSKPFLISDLGSNDYPWGEISTAMVELEATCRNHKDRTDTIQVPRSHWYEYVKGAFVQDVFPYLSPQGREVVISQRMPYAYLCEQCWDQLGEEE